MIFGRRFSPRRAFPHQAVLVLLLGILSISNLGWSEDDFCSGRIKFFRELKGVIQTPNFPGRFPVPFHCKYVIVNRPDSNVIFTFTQMYLTTGVVMAEYTSISNTSSSQENTRVWPLAQTRNPNFAPNMARSTKSPFPAIEVDLKTLRNVNIRVLDNLLDVYGFNITYEIVPANFTASGDAWRKRGDARGCSMLSSCSYNGNCFASSDFKNYTCSCFKGYWGSNCQKGSLCNSKEDNPNVPERNPCRNGENCLVIGSKKIHCSCKAGYTGAICEKKIEERAPLKGLSGIVCNVGLKPNTNPLLVSTELKEIIDAVSAKMFTLGYFLFWKSSASFHLRFNSTVSQIPVIETRNGIRKEKYVRELMPPAAAYRSDEKSCVNFGEQYTQNDSRLRQHFVSVLGIDSEDYRNAAKVTLNELAQKTKAPDSFYNSSFSCIFENPLDADLQIADPKESSQRLNTCKFELSSLDRPVKEGENFELTCRAPYSPNRKFVWTKYDGKSIDPQNAIRRMYIRQNEVQMDGCFSSSFEVKKATRHDAGVYICQVEDCLIPRGQELKKSITVSVEVKPIVILSPPSASVYKKSNLTIDCFFEDNNLDYWNYTPQFQWKKNGLPLKQTDNEFYEELFPGGSLLLLSNIE